jgi:hypothetical protein
MTSTTTKGHNMTEHAEMMMRLHTEAPEWLNEECVQSRIVGWRLMTEARDSVAYPVGYEIVLDGGILQTRMDGIGVRSTMLNMV